MSSSPSAVKNVALPARLASCTAATPPPPPASSQARDACDDVAGRRHLRQARELDPLGVPDDSDAHGAQCHRARRRASGTPP